MTRPSLRTYLQEARRWDQDRLAAALAGRRRALWAAGAMAALAGTACLALAALAPLKTVEPFVVRIDRSTGEVGVLSALADPPLRYEEAVSRYFVAEYVRTREGWLPGAAEQAYRRVALMSAPDVQRRFAQAYRGDNPDSPQNRLGRDAVAEVRIRALSFLSPEVAQVRFTRVVRTPIQTREAGYIATVGFTYVQTPMRQADRLINPLGFQVVDYRLDPEIAP